LIEIGGENFDWEDIDPVNSYADYLFTNLKLSRVKDDSFFRELFGKYNNNRAPSGTTTLENSELKPTPQNDPSKPKDPNDKKSKPRRLQSLWDA
jgi:hypothetical protein